MAYEDAVVHLTMGAAASPGVSLRVGLQRARVMGQSQPAHAARRDSVRRTVSQTIQPAISPGFKLLANVPICPGRGRTRASHPTRLCRSTSDKHNRPPPSSPALDLASRTRNPASLLPAAPLLSPDHLVRVHVRVKQTSALPSPPPGHYATALGNTPLSLPDNTYHLAARGLFSYVQSPVGMMQHSSPCFAARCCLSGVHAWFQLTDFRRHIPISRSSIAAWPAIPVRARQLRGPPWVAGRPSSRGSQDPAVLRARATAL
ncbi:hypothetical protein OBBRIDRAFT_112874 [Obba rivulosa]|uniref:Uncharacterized protein n=1 Tax=Obba rivulosa TaxID=1052685 RepID=A0A8E2DIK0_9APHY|nr:hypothetical protein OBBRIDRAFT_112874 [Obba rivulosa]